MGDLVYTCAMGNIVIKSVPDDLKKEFKMMCVDKNVSMSAKIIELLKQEVEHYKDSK